jgi:hypothetical protein
MGRTSRDFWSAVFHVGIAALLYGCGGGGDDGSSGNSPSAMSLSATPASLAFSGVDGGTLEPPTQQISIQSSGGTVYVAVTYAGIAYEAAPLQMSGATATATVRVPAPNIVGAGVHTGTVTLRGYEYQFGGAEVSGSPRQVSVTYSVAGLSANPALLVFNQNPGGPLPGAQVVTLSDGLNPAASDSWSATVEHAPIIGLTVPTWLQVSPLSGSTLPATLTASVVAQGQAGIEYDGYINVMTVNGATKRIHAIYRAN